MLIPLTINPEPSLGIQTIFHKELTDQSLVYPESNNQATFCQMCLKVINMVGISWYFLV